MFISKKIIFKKCTRLILEKNPIEWSGDVRFCQKDHPPIGAEEAW
jgi:hypothetical protein